MRRTATSGGTLYRRGVLDIDTQAEVEVRVTPEPTCNVNIRKFPRDLSRRLDVLASVMHTTKRDLMVTSVREWLAKRHLDGQQFREPT